MVNLILNEEAETLSREFLELLKSCMEETLTFEEFPFDAEISFSVTDNAGIRELNHEARGIDKATDVLSFPMLMLEDGALIVEDSDIQDNCVFLGDIVISTEKAEEQAEAYAAGLYDIYHFCQRQSDRVPAE